MTNMGDVGEHDPQAFKQLFQRDTSMFRIMGLSGLTDILTEQKLTNEWWDGSPLLIGVITISTVVMCEFRTMLQMFHEDLNYAILLFSVICSGGLSAVKAMRLWTYRSEMFDLLHGLAVMWESARNEKLLTKKIAKAAVHTTILMKYYTILVTFLGISYIIRPYVVLLDYELHKDVNVSFDFSQVVYPSYLPFTIDSFTKFFMCVTYQQFVGISACIFWVSSDTLFAQLATHVSLQFLILAEKLKRTINNLDALNDRQALQHMANIVDGYHQLFVCCYSIQTFFNPIIFFTVLSNAMNLCCCLYQLNIEVEAGNWNEVTKNLAHLMTLSIQTMIFCCFADMLTESSKQISEAIYCSQWTNCNQNFKMILLMIMIRARHEFSYKAYGIIILNYKQLTSIANGAVSYFMLLRNI